MAAFAAGHVGADPVDVLALVKGPEEDHETDSGLG